MGTPTNTVTVLLFSLTMVLLLENSFMKSMLVKWVLTYQSQYHCQCSVSLVPEAVSGVINIFTVNKPSNSTLNIRPLLNCGELKMLLKSVLLLACHKLNNLLLISIERS